MADLATVDEAKTYLRLIGSDYDAELALKIPQASAIVLDYISFAESDIEGDDLDVVKAATLEVVKAMVSGSDGPPLGGDVKNILRRFRDPPLA